MLWTISIFNKLKRYQRPDIKISEQKHQLVPCYDISIDVSLIYVRVETSLQSVKLVSLTELPAYIIAASQIGRFDLRTSETSQRHLK